LGEAFKGDRVIAKCRVEDALQPRFSHTIFREEDQAELIRARTIWHQK
jgi:hypothetical protein